VLRLWRREVRLMLRGSLATLAQAGRALRRGTRCRIIVSNALARYALVPFSTAVVGREAEEALAGHVFRGTHGERAGDWRIRVAPARRGARRIACALDATMLDAIPAAAAEHGLRLTAIEPAWAAGYNAAYRRLPASCWFAVTEPGRLVLGLLIDGEWRQLAAERCGVDARAALRQALLREGTLADDPAAARLPCWVAHFALATPTVEALA
jgi:hypothetical protein